MYSGVSGDLYSKWVLISMKIPCVRYIGSSLKYEFMKFHLHFFEKKKKVPIVTLWTDPSVSLRKQGYCFYLKPIASYTLQSIVGCTWRVHYNSSFLKISPSQPLLYRIYLDIDYTGSHWGLWLLNVIVFYSNLESEQKIFSLKCHKNQQKSLVSY